MILQPSAFLQQIYVNKSHFPRAILCLCNPTVILTKLVFKLEFVFYVKTDVSPLLEWCSFGTAKGYKHRK